MCYCFLVLILFYIFLEESVSENVVDIQGVHFSYDGAPVLRDVSLQVKQGDFLAILGPNGGGKSTLLKLMLGLLQPELGTVSVLGLPAGKAGGRIGYMPQYTHVSDSFPIAVLDAVIMGEVKSGLAGVAGLRPGRKNVEKAMIALERVGMADYAGRRIHNLSGGQKQRVFIARALVADPELLLLDEPTASVDHHHKGNFFDLLGELNREMTVIMVSHDISALSRNVRSVACVNRSLHHHDTPVVTPEMFREAYGSDQEGCCPMELVTHGDIPHRVLQKHDFEE